MRYLYFFIGFSITILLIGCTDAAQQSAPTATNTATPAADSPVTIQDTLPPVTAMLNESFNEADTAFNETYTKELAPIRAYFQRINTTTNWGKKEHRNVDDVSSEGAEAMFYYNDNQLQKIAAWFYRETGQSLVEYYILNGKLALVNEKQARYNRPMYYDSAAMKANNDTELLDPAKTTYSKLRSYFINDRLIYQVNYEDCGGLDSDSLLLAEQQRLFSSYVELLKQSQQP